MIHDPLSYPEIYDIQLNLQFLARSPKELLHRFTDGKIFKLLRIESQLYLVSVEPSSEGLNVAYHYGSPDAHHRAEILHYIVEWLDLTKDLSSFYTIAERSSVMRKLVAKYRGYRIIGMPDLYESLSWAIIGQQINLSFAFTLKQRLVETFGDHIIHEDQRYYVFPRPEVIAALTAERLIALQFSRQKAAYLLNVAKAFVDSVLSQEKIARLPFQEANEELQRIKGIGNWTANYALMKTFRFPNAFPLEDAGLHNAIRNLHKLKAKPSIEHVRKIFRQFKGWEAYATLYYWKSLA